MDLFQHSSPNYCPTIVQFLVSCYFVTLIRSWPTLSHVLASTSLSTGLSTTRPGFSHPLSPSGYAWNSRPPATPWLYSTQPHHQPSSLITLDLQICATRHNRKGKTLLTVWTSVLITSSSGTRTPPSSLRVVSYSTISCQNTSTYYLILDYHDTAYSNETKVSSTGKT